MNREIPRKKRMKRLALLAALAMLLPAAGLAEATHSTGSDGRSIQWEINIVDGIPVCVDAVAMPNEANPVPLYSAVTTWIEARMTRNTSR